MAEGVVRSRRYLYFPIRHLTFGIPMEHDASPEGTPEQALAADRTSAVSRRSLLRAGVGAAPVVLTLASRPVSAGVCQTASAITSAGSPNRVVASVSSCSGSGPNTLQASWTSTRTAATSSTPSSKFVVSVGSTNVKDTNATLLDVLKDPGKKVSGNAEQLALARNLVAAYANYLSGATDPQVLSLDTIQRAWTTGWGSQFVVAGTTTKWGPADLNAWLTKMFASS